MQFTTEDGTVIRDPNSSALRTALGKLGSRGNSYAILAAAPEHYIQAAGNDAQGYVAEYREGSEETHHSSTATNLSREQIVDLMTAYLDGASWKGMITWESGFGSKPLPAREPDRRARVIIAVIIVVTATFFALGIRDTLATRQFLQRAVEVRGQVVQIVRNSNARARIVEYQDLQGSTHRLEVPIRSKSTAVFHEGEYVQVIYDPTDPAPASTAKIATFGQIWGGCLVMLFIGAGGIVMGSIHWWVESRGR
jgi:Protein of unknown function (DUF3592)